MSWTPVAIVAIIAWAIVQVTGGRKKNKHDAEYLQQTEAMQRHIDALQERIEILEKIVTDEKYDLKKKFDDLENDRVA
ncbi:hypothetical protein [Aestuariibacter salexigens]|uniref:hypothetical protein n=1 Tax=Aestuariibacter salexigens TaxID=226010 RepID=UPI000400E309|nr:hypothetical protein [Aestuariibacter salexigens]